jgi:hypothetical protein
MDIENLWNVWEAGGRLYARCEKPRREGLKSVRPCSNQYELDVRTLLWTRGRAFPISMLSSRMRCPKCGAREVSVRLSLPGAVLEAQAKARRP